MNAKLGSVLEALRSPLLALIFLHPLLANAAQQHSVNAHGSSPICAQIIAWNGDTQGEDNVTAHQHFDICAIIIFDSPTALLPKKNQVQSSERSPVTPITYTNPPLALHLLAFQPRAPPPSV